MSDMHEFKSFILILLLLMLPIIPISFIQNTKAATTWRVPQDYPTIDDAIIAANAGDMIEVISGLFQGFTIDKAVTIIGSGKENSSIIGTVNISGTGSRISGFSFQQPETLRIYGENNEVFNSSIECDVEIVGNRNELSWNSIYGEIEIDYITNNNVETQSTHNVIENNNVFSNIFVRHSHSNSISFNKINGEIFCDMGNENRIIGNEVNNGSISLESDGNKNFVSKNQIKTQNFGIHISGKNNTISYNNINSFKSGIELYGSSNQIFANQIISEEYGIISGYGNCKIKSNNIISKNDGIYLSEIGARDSQEIAYNTIVSNASGITGLGGYGTTVIGNYIVNCYYGIKAEEGNELIVANTINNCEIGIELNSSNFRERTQLVFRNNFIENSIHAVDNSGSTWFNGTQGNYWSGWNSPDINDDGIVDKPYVIPGDGRSADKYPAVNLISNQLNVELKCDSARIISKSEVNFEVHVQYESEIIQEASITISDFQGTVKVSSGFTNEFGIFTFVYTAPTSNLETESTITATASKIGYLNGSDTYNFTLVPLENGSSEDAQDYDPEQPENIPFEGSQFNFDFSTELLVVTGIIVVLLIVGISFYKLRKNIRGKLVFSN